MRREGHTIENNYTWSAEAACNIQVSSSALTNYNYSNPAGLKKKKKAVTFKVLGLNVFMQSLTKIFFINVFRSFIRLEMLLCSAH